MKTIQFDQLRVVYSNKDGDRIALNGVSLVIGRESIALLGPNGSGKSTLMGVLAGTLTADDGVVHRNYENGLGVVFQTPALDELLTVRENLALAGALHGMTKDAAGSAIVSVADALELTDRLDQQVRHLSGGLKRRTDLARALLPGPGLLLLDEPTSGLDVEARASLWSALDTIRNESEMAVVYATHMTEEAAKADRVVLFADGKIVIDGAPSELIEGLGSSVLRIRLSDEMHAASVVQWSKEIGCPSVSRGKEVLISHAKPEHAGKCPGDPESVTLAAPTLEDVYLWHARSNFSEGLL